VRRLIFISNTPRPPRPQTGLKPSACAHVRWSCRVFLTNAPRPWPELPGLPGALRPERPEGKAQVAGSTMLRAQTDTH